MKIAVVTRYFPQFGRALAGPFCLSDTARLPAKPMFMFFPNANIPPLLKPEAGFTTLDASYCVPDVKELLRLSRAAPGFPAHQWLDGRPRPLCLTSASLRPISSTASSFTPMAMPLSRSAKLLGSCRRQRIGSDINRVYSDIAAAPRADSCAAVFRQCTRATVVRKVDYLFTVSNDLRRKAIAMGAHPEKTRAISTAATSPSSTPETGVRQG